MERDEELERIRTKAAIAEAGDEVGLDEWYRSCVEPLMSVEESRMPQCCGAGCEPCSTILAEVAIRARRRLAAADAG